MAPWNCGLKTANLIYITSAPGTPENTMAATTLWQRGQPSPPWAYEYQYPVDCLRECFVIPATSKLALRVVCCHHHRGYAAVPPHSWQGPPVKFKVQNDTFIPVTGATVAVGGAGYLPGDIIFGPGALNPTTGQQPGAAQGLQPVRRTRAVACPYYRWRWRSCDSLRHFTSQ